MFDFGWDEMALIAVVALVVLGPKELPQVMRTAGQWSRKLKLMAREFHSHVDEMVREAELNEVAEAARKAAMGDVSAVVTDTVDPDGSLRETFSVYSNLEEPKPAEPLPEEPTPSIAQPDFAVEPPTPVAVAPVELPAPHKEGSV